MPTYEGLEDGYRRAKEQIAQLEAEISEFQVSSRELEKELEVELEESERRHKELEAKVERLSYEVKDWRVCLSL
jgi:predicted  nucleic acid-binding Zn-ribbon protein